MPSMTAIRQPGSDHRERAAAHSAQRLAQPQVAWAIENISKDPSFIELAAAVRAAGRELFEIKSGSSRLSALP